MSTLDPLSLQLLTAGQWLGRLSHPQSLTSPEDALDAVRNYLGAEHIVLSIPGAREALIRELNVPLDPTGARMNHAMMAGRILARSGWPGAEEALLAAARSDEQWVAAQARINLGYLAPTGDASAALRREIESIEDHLAGALQPALLPLLVDALIHLRDPGALPLIARFIHSPGDEQARGWALISLVELMPEAGLSLAEQLREHASPVLSATAKGLRAVYGVASEYEEVLGLCVAGGGQASSGLRWAGRIVRPESLAALAGGLSHPEPATRLDVVTSLACFGVREAWSLVARALDDPDAMVAAQALGLLMRWLMVLPEGAQAMQSLTYTARGALDARSRRALRAAADRALEGYTPGVRYEGEAPLTPAELLNHLYFGTLPDWYWSQWVATTGQWTSYSTRRGLLFNYPALERLEDWYQAHAGQFVAGAFHYAGRVVTGG